MLNLNIPFSHPSVEWRVCSRLCWKAGWCSEVLFSKKGTDPDLRAQHHALCFTCLTSLNPHNVISVSVLIPLMSSLPRRSPLRTWTWLSTRPLAHPVLSLHPASSSPDTLPLHPPKLIVCTQQNPVSLPPPPRDASPSCSFLRLAPLRTHFSCCPLKWGWLCSLRPHTPGLRELGEGAHLSLIVPYHSHTFLLLSSLGTRSSEPPFIRLHHPLFHIIWACNNGALPAISPWF